jgi:hypothetical protein
VKTIWTGRIARAGAKYGESAPMATACCNACRACVTGNVLTVAMGAIAGAGYAVTNFARRQLAKTS